MESTEYQLVPNRTLIGRVLVSCEDHVCGDKYFKCPGFYCLPWRYVCNGEWECPGGVDEKNCDRTICPGMFMCKNSSICITTDSLCDLISDCYLNDDENYCPIDRVPNKCPSD